jgi:hypothetical protein
MKTKEPKREPPGLGYAREACKRIHAAGKTVSTRAVLAEVFRARGVNISNRDSTVACQQWRAETMARTSGRVDAAVDALLSLETDLERDAVRQAIQTRTGGGIRVRFTVAARNTGGGHKKRRTTPLPKSGQ